MSAPKPASPLRASLYVRLSNAADESNVSLSGMAADLRAECERQGWTEVAFHTDDGASGAIRDRKGFLAWLADGRDGRADVLLTWSGDRVSREGANALALLLDVIEGKDATTGAVVRPPVRFRDLQGLDSQDGDAFRLVMLVKGEGARMERNAIVTRNRAKNARLRAAGRWHGGTPPFGTRPVPAPDGAGKVLAAEPTEAALLVQVAERILSGESVASASRWLTTHARPRYKDAWSRTALAQTLTSAAVAGTDGRDGLVFPADYAARVRAALKSTRPADRHAAARTGGGKGTKRLLSGLVVCDACGSRMRVSNSPALTYRCPAKSDGRSCPAGTTISSPRLEAYVSDLIVSGGSFLQLSEKVATVVPGNADERAAAEAVLTAARSAWESDDTDDTLAAYRAARDAFQALPVVESQVVTEHRATGTTLADRWLASDDEGRRQILLDSGLRFRISPTTSRGPGLDASRVVPEYLEEATA